MKCSSAHAMDELQLVCEKISKDDKQLSSVIMNALRQCYDNETRVRAIIENIEGSIWMVDINRQLIDFNHQFSETCKMFTDRKPKTGMPVFDFITGSEKKLLEKKLGEVFLGKKLVYEFSIGQNNDKQYYRTSLNPISSGGKITGAAAYSIEITSSKKAEEQHIKEKKLSDSIINSLPGIFYLQDESGKHLRWNKNFETISGFEANEIPQLDPLIFYEPAEHARIKSAIEKVYKEGYAEIETEVITKHGKKIPYYLNGMAIEYEGKRCLIGTGIDISAREKAQEETRKSEEKYRSIFEQALDGIMIADFDGKIIDVNPSMCQMFGYTRQELLDRNLVDLYDPEYLKSDPIRFDLLKAGATITRARSMLHKNGQLIEVEYNVKKIFNDRSITFHRDVTQFREADMKFKNLVEKSLVGVYIIQDSKFAYVNPKFAQIFGYEQKELIDTYPVDILVDEKERPAIMQKLRARFQSGKESIHDEVRGQKKDGGIIWIEVFGSRTIYKGNTAVIGTLLDITQRKIADESLQKSEANLHTIFDTTDNIYVLLDKNFQIISFNQPACNFAEKELHVSFHASDNFIDFFSRDRRHALLGWMKKALAGKHINYEISYLQPDGSFNWYYVRMFPIMNIEKKIFGLMVAASDITGQKITEQQLRHTLEQLTHQKVQEQKKITRAVIKAQEKERNKIGQELHDNVNQMLASTRIYLSMAKRTPVVKKELVVKSIEFIDDAIHEIRLLSKQHVTPARVINLKDLTQSLVDHLTETSRLKISFDYHVPENFKADNDLKLNIYRVLQEQLNNILKHASAKKVNILVEIRDGDIHVVLTDDGKGFDVKKKKAGIGISNITNRVESYNGGVTIESKPGKGCKLHIRIPLVFMN